MVCKLYLNEFEKNRKANPKYRKTKNERERGEREREEKERRRGGEREKRRQEITCQHFM